MVLGRISENMKKNHYFMALFLAKTPLRNSIAMAKPRIIGDQKLFERLCYMLKLQVTKFQLPSPKGF